MRKTISIKILLQPAPEEAVQSEEFPVDEKQDITVDDKLDNPVDENKAVGEKSDEVAETDKVEEGEK